MNNLIAISDVSTLLGIAKTTVYKMVQSGEIEYIRIGKAIRFEPESIKRYVKSRTQKQKRKGFSSTKVNDSKGGGLLWEL